MCESKSIALYIAVGASFALGQSILGTLLLLLSAKNRLQLTNRHKYTQHRSLNLARSGALHFDFWKLTLAHLETGTSFLSTQSCILISSKWRSSICCWRREYQAISFLKWILVHCALMAHFCCCFISTELHFIAIGRVAKFRECGFISSIARFFSSLSSLLFIDIANALLCSYPPRILFTI